MDTTADDASVLDLPSSPLKPTLIEEELQVPETPPQTASADSPEPPEELSPIPDEQPAEVAEDLLPEDPSEVEKAKVEEKEEEEEEDEDEEEEKEEEEEEEEGEGEEGGKKRPGKRRAPAAGPPQQDGHSAAKRDFGLSFEDVPLQRDGMVPKLALERVVNFKGMLSATSNQYRLGSINTVCWSPNLGAANWLLSAGQAGVARLSWLGLLNRRLLSKDSS